MEQKNKKGVKLGIFIFVGLVFFLAGILSIGNINKSFTKTITTTTIFDDVSGLQPGDNIWFSGVKVGTVKDLKFLDNANVEVTMKIEKKSTSYIPHDAKTKISSDGLIGNKIIVIYGGTSNTGHIQEGDKLEHVTTFSTEDMINMLQENNKNILDITNDFKVITKKMANGEGTIGKLFSNDSLYNQLLATINTFKRAAGNAESLTASINEFTDKLNSGDGLANKLVTDTTVFNKIRVSVDQINEITQSANEVADNLKITTEGINQNENTPVGVLLHDEKSAESLKTSIQNLESVTKKLNESLDALQHSIFLRKYFKKKAEADSLKK